MKVWNSNKEICPKIGNQIRLTPEAMKSSLEEFRENVADRHEEIKAHLSEEIKKKRQYNLINHLKSAETKKKTIGSRYG